MLYIFFKVGACQLDDYVKLSQPFADAEVTGAENDLVLVNIHNPSGGNIQVCTGGSLNSGQVQLPERADVINFYQPGINDAQGGVYVTTEVEHIFVSSQDLTQLLILLADGVAVDDDLAVEGQRTGVFKQIVAGGKDGHTVFCPLVQNFIHPLQGLILQVHSVADGVNFIALDGVVAVFVQYQAAVAGLTTLGVVGVDGQEVVTLVGDSVTAGLNDAVVIHIVAGVVQSNSAVCDHFFHMTHHVLPVQGDSCLIVGVFRTVVSIVVTQTVDKQSVIQTVLVQKSKHIFISLGYDGCVGFIGKVAAAHNHIQINAQLYKLTQQVIKTVHSTGSAEVDIAGQQHSQQRIFFRCGHKGLVSGQQGIVQGDQGCVFSCTQVSRLRQNAVQSGDHIGLVCVILSTNLLQAGVDLVGQGINAGSIVLCLCIHNIQRAGEDGDVVDDGVTQTVLTQSVSTEGQGVDTQNVVFISGNVGDGDQFAVNIDAVSAISVVGNHNMVPGIVLCLPDAVSIAVSAVSSGEAGGSVLVMRQLQEGHTGSIQLGVLVREDGAAHIVSRHIHFGAGDGGVDTAGPLIIAAVFGAVPEGDGVIFFGDVVAGIGQIHGQVVLCGSAEFVDQVQTGLAVNAGDKTAVLEGGGIAVINGVYGDIAGGSILVFKVNAEDHIVLGVSGLFPKDLVVIDDHIVRQSDAGALLAGTDPQLAVGGRKNQTGGNSAYASYIGVAGDDQLIEVCQAEIEDAGVTVDAENRLAAFCGGYVVIGDLAAAEDVDNIVAVNGDGGAVVVKEVQSQGDAGGGAGQVTLVVVTHLAGQGGNEIHVHVDSEAISVDVVAAVGSQSLNGAAHQVDHNIANGQTCGSSAIGGKLSHSTAQHICGDVAGSALVAGHNQQTDRGGATLGVFHVANVGTSSQTAHPDGLIVTAEDGQLVILGCISGTHCGGVGGEDLKGLALVDREAFAEGHISAAVHINSAGAADDGQIADVGLVAKVDADGFGEVQGSLSCFAVVHIVVNGGNDDLAGYGFQIGGCCDFQLAAQNYGAALNGGQQGVCLGKGLHSGFGSQAVAGSGDSAVYINDFRIGDLFVVNLTASSVCNSAADGSLNGNILGELIHTGVGGICQDQYAVSAYSDILAGQHRNGGDFASAVQVDSIVAADISIALDTVQVQRSAVCNGGAFPAAHSIGQIGHRVGHIDSNALHCGVGALSGNSADGAVVQVYYHIAGSGGSIGRAANLCNGAAINGGSQIAGRGGASHGGIGAQNEVCGNSTAVHSNGDIAGGAASPTAHKNGMVQTAVNGHADFVACRSVQLGGEELQAILAFDGKNRNVLAQNHIFICIEIGGIAGGIERNVVDIGFCGGIEVRGCNKVNGCGGGIILAAILGGDLNLTGDGIVAFQINGTAEGNIALDHDRTACGGRFFSDISICLLQGQEGSVLAAVAGGSHRAVNIDNAGLFRLAAIAIAVTVTVAAVSIQQGAALSYVYGNAIGQFALIITGEGQGAAGFHGHGLTAGQGACVSCGGTVLNMDDGIASQCAIGHLAGVAVQVHGGGDDISGAGQVHLAEYAKGSGDGCACANINGKALSIVGVGVGSRVSTHFAYGAALQIQNHIADVCCGGVGRVGNSVNSFTGGNADGQVAGMTLVGTHNQQTEIRSFFQAQSDVAHIFFRGVAAHKDGVVIAALHSKRHIFCLACTASGFVVAAEDLESTAGGDAFAQGHFSAGEQEESACLGRIQGDVLKFRFRSKIKGDTATTGNGQDGIVSRGQGNKTCNGVGFEVSICGKFCVAADYDLAACFRCIGSNVSIGLLQGLEGIVLAAGAGFRCSTVNIDLRGRGRQSVVDSVEFSGQSLSRSSVHFAQIQGGGDCVSFAKSALNSHSQLAHDKVFTYIDGDAAVFIDGACAIFDAANRACIQVNGDIAVGGTCERTGVIQVGNGAGVDVHYNFFNIDTCNVATGIQVGNGGSAAHSDGGSAGNIFCVIAGADIGPSAGADLDYGVFNIAVVIAADDADLRGVITTGCDIFTNNQTGRSVNVQIFVSALGQCKIFNYNRTAKIVVRCAVAAFVETQDATRGITIFTGDIIRAGMALRSSNIISDGTGNGAYNNDNSIGCTVSVTQTLHSVLEGLKGILNAAVDGFYVAAFCRNIDHAADGFGNQRFCSGSGNQCRRDQSQQHCQR